MIWGKRSYSCVRSGSRVRILNQIKQICCIDNYPRVNVQTIPSVYYDNPSLRITKLYLKLMLNFILRSAIIMVLNNGLSVLYAYLNCRIVVSRILYGVVSWGGVHCEVKHLQFARWSCVEWGVSSKVRCSCTSGSWWVCDAQLECLTIFFDALQSLCCYSERVTGDGTMALDRPVRFLFRVRRGRNEVSVVSYP